METATSNPLRPSSQPRDQLVLQVENVAIAGRRLLSIEIFEVLDAKATGTLSSSLRSTPSTPLTSARNSGFRVAARDDLENEYSLFVTRQRAEYLYRSEFPVEGIASESINSEDIANGILAHLHIIGNRQRDVGKLVCREPEPHIEKKTRVLPVSTPPHKQKNPHLPSKRQDQRAVRVQKTSNRTMEAVAKAMKRPDFGLSGEDESEVESGAKFDRKGSEVSILHRMAVGDSKTMWKAELETNYEESEHPLSILEEDDDNIHKDPSYMLAPGLSPVKRALPERKTKHKDLEERRQKGRQQRIFIAQVAQEATPLGLQGIIQDQDSCSTFVEETGHDIDSTTSRRSSMVAVSNTERRASHPRVSSAPRSSVGNAYALKNLPELDPSEPEHFLRRRTLDTHRSVLRKDTWQDDIPGMGIEITDERPTLQTPNRLDPLLTSARRVMMVNAVGSLQWSTSSLRQVSERKRSRTSTSPSLFSTALNASNSAPTLQVENSDLSKRVNFVPAQTAIEEPLASPEHALEPQLKYAVDTNSPQSPAKLTNGEANSEPSLEFIHPVSLTIPESVEAPVSDKLPEISTESVSTPRSSAQLMQEEHSADTQSRLRPRSNSLGSEGVGRLSPLQSTTKPPVQEFLAPPEPEITVPIVYEGEAVPENEIPTPALDPEIVLHSPPDLVHVAESNVEIAAIKGEESVHPANTLSFQEAMSDMQALQSSLPTVVITSSADLGVQEDQQNVSPKAFPPDSQQDLVLPPTTRKDCWEEPDPPVISPDGRDEPFKVAEIDDALRASAPTMSTQQQSPRLEENANTKLQKETNDLQELENYVIPDNQTQARSSRISDNEDQDDRNEKDTPTASKEISLDTTIDNTNNAENAEDIADSHIVDVDGELTETSCNEYFASKVDPENTGRLDSMEEDTGYQEIYSGHDGESADTKTFASDSAGETITFPLASSEDMKARNQNNDILPTARDLSESIIPSTMTISSSEEPAKTPIGEEKMIFQEKYCDHGHRKNEKDLQADKIRQKIAERPQKTEVKHMKHLLPTSEVISINNKVVASPSAQQKQLIVEPFTECKMSTTISRKRSLSPSKMAGPKISTGQAKTTSKGMSSRRRSTITKVKDAQIVQSKLERRHTTDVKDDDLFRGLRRTSAIDHRNALPGLATGTLAMTVAKTTDEKSLGTMLRLNSKDEMPPKRHSSQHSKVVQGVTNYHKKWGKWIAGKSIIEKVGCLQLEELVMADPENEENLLKLGLRYARCSGTSMQAILLLEHAALLHKNAAGTREYWFWLGSAHLDIFMRHRKYLPVARFHLNKSLRAYTSAFAYLESLADPMLLLRYAIGLFWQKGDENLEKTRDIFHELFSQFVSFCDKDRPNLLFLQFQVLHRLKLYVDAIDCIAKIIALHGSHSNQSIPNGAPVLPSIAHSTIYDAADYHLMLMQCQQASGDYVAAAQSLASVLKLKSMQQETTLRDEEYFDLWCSLAGKCFHHEDYALALEYYAIALNFAKQSQVLATIHYNIGLCFQSLDEDNKCVTEYKRARTANRHVPPLVSVAELGNLYDEHFAKLLQKSVVQTIEEVRAELYGKAVRRLQRVFRLSRRNVNVDPDSNSSGASPTRMPSLSKRRSSIAAARNPPTLVKIVDSTEETEGIEGDNLQQKVATTNDNQVNRDEESTLEVVERRHQSFLARKQVVMEEMTELLTNPQYCGRETSPSSHPNARFQAAAQMRSGLLSPEKDRLDARRKQSMETYRQLGYIPSTMPWIEFWEKLLALASELFESRQALYGNIARIRGRLPLVTDDVAFCALAESIGNVHEAAKKLHDASYERELTYVCAVIEVSKQLERGFPLDPTQLSLKSPHVSLPTISSPRAHTLAAHSSQSPAKVHHVVLPPYSPTRASESPSTKPKKHLRMNQMLNLHFQEHVQNQEAAIAIAEATGGFVQPEHRTEKLVVLQDFRLANNVLLSSQLAFGSEKAAI